MKKCLVLDLDNTLWGGVIGEDGIDGIHISFEKPGSFYLAFQQAILDLYNRGIILAIASKNNEEDALAVFREHPNMLLKEHHFAAHRINWNDKTENIRELAKDLNIGLDSMVFLDDDPLNRGLVRAELPEVEVPEFPKDPKEYAKFLLNLPYFGSDTAFTDEDKMRGNMYMTERLRQKAEGGFSSREEFLENLGLEVYCYVNDVSCISRLAQMTDRTNQFNSVKNPLSDEKIREYIEKSTHDVLHVKARDSFGDYGIIGLAIIKKGDRAEAETFLMSCRALGKGIEETFLHALIKHAKDNYGAGTVTVPFKKSEKNKPVEDFLEKYFDTDEKHHYFIQNEFPKPQWVKLAWK